MTGDLLELMFDHEMLKVLISGTKLKILRRLCIRQMTAAELAHDIGMYKNGINKHITTLLKTGLLERIESDQRKWVYYRLTEKGEEIISSGKIYVLLLISGIIGGLAFIATLVNFYFPKYSEVPEAGLDKGFSLIKPLISSGEVVLRLVIFVILFIVTYWALMKKDRQ